MKKIIIGLGNPGEKYQNHRHNAGQMMIEFLKNQSLPSDFLLLKSTTYMNESGIFVKKILKKYQIKPENLYIIHDDLDIPLGKFKIDFAQGPKLHNGLISIETQLKTKNFWRIRIGIDNRIKNQWVAGETYVLQNFLNQEKKLLIEKVFPAVYQKLVHLNENSSS